MHNELSMRLLASANITVRYTIRRTTGELPLMAYMADMTCCPLKS